MNYKNMIIILIGLSYFVNTLSYVYQVSVMKKEHDKYPNGYQTIIGIGDYHDKNHPANRVQREYIESIIKKCKKGKLVVEDLSSVNNDGKGMCCRYMINARGGLLGKLADAIRAQSVDVDNVEYRYCRVTGVGPLLYNQDKDPYTLNSVASIMIKAVGKEVTDEIEKIRQHNDGPILNALYKKTVDEVMKELQHLGFDTTEDKTIADYSSRLPKKSYSKDLEKMCIFDSALLDMKIMHSIVSSPDKSTILVVAGGSHIEKMEVILSTLGYKKVIGIDAASKKHHALENALGSEGQKASFSLYPPALNLQFLDSFIN